MMGQDYTPPDMSTDTSDVTQFWRRLAKEPIVMLTDMFHGGLRARPMGAMTRADEGVVWFMTARDSAKVDEVAARSEVCLNVVDPADNFYMSVTGDCEVIDDRSKVHELWNPGHKLFFDGPEDPRIILLKVTPTQGQIWDGPAGPVAAIKMLFGVLTGSKPDLGEVRKVDL